MHYITEKERNIVKELERRIGFINVHHVIIYPWNRRHHCWYVCHCHPSIMPSHYLLRDSWRPLWPTYANLQQLSLSLCEDMAACYGTAQSTSSMLVSCSQPLFLRCSYFKVMSALMVAVYSLQWVQVSYSAMCDSATRRNNELSCGS